MKKFSMTLVALLCIVTMTSAQTAALAQSQSPTPNQNEQSPTTPQQPALSQNAVSQTTTARGNEIATGTEIHATLDSRLSSDTSKVGDRFTATVNEPVRTADGNVAIPAGSKIQGEVTEVEQGKTVAVLRGRAKMNMRFNAVQLPSGGAFPITATLTSVHTTSGGTKASTTGNEGEVSGSKTGTSTAKDIGIGAGAGTLAGLIFGSAMKGLVIGAIAGGGYVLATSGKKVDMPQQTGLVLRVDNNVPVTHQP